MGELINPNTAQYLQALIVENTATSIAVAGACYTFVTLGDPYQVIDYHLQPGSAAIDQGRDVSDPAFGSVMDDFDGDARGVDGDGLGPATGDGSDYDIGADEAPDITVPVVFTGYPWEYTYDVADGQILVTDSVFGRDGTRTITYAPSVTFANGIIYTTVVVGTLDNDSLLGTLGNDILIGLAGNDKLNGHNGDDLLVGGGWGGLPARRDYGR